MTKIACFKPLPKKNTRKQYTVKKLKSRVKNKWVLVPDFDQWIFEFGLKIGSILPEILKAVWGKFCISDGEVDESLFPHATPFVLLEVPFGRAKFSNFSASNTIWGLLGVCLVPSVPYLHPVDCPDPGKGAMLSPCVDESLENPKKN